MIWGYVPVFLETPICILSTQVYLKKTIYERKWLRIILKIDRVWRWTRKLETWNHDKASIWIQFCCLSSVWFFFWIFSWHSGISGVNWWNNLLQIPNLNQEHGLSFLDPKHPKPPFGHSLPWFFWSPKNFAKTSWRVSWVETLNPFLFGHLYRPHNSI